MHNLPQDFEREIHYLGIMKVFSNYLNDCGQNLFKEKREYNFLFLNDRELEIGADGYDTMENRAEIGPGIKKRD